MDSASTEFAALLGAARAGDEGAARRLLEQYTPVVRRVAHHLLRPALRPFLDSVDLVQSVHRSLLLGLRSRKLRVASPEHLTALALTLLQRKVARQWRRYQARQTASLEAAAARGSIRSPTVEGREADPAHVIAFRDAFEHLLSRLDDLDRQLLEYRFLGYSTAETARQLGLDSGFLRVRLGRLRARLRTSGVLNEWI